MAVLKNQRNYGNVEEKVNHKGAVAFKNINLFDDLDKHDEDNWVL